LHRGDQLISLPPKAVETLLALVGNSGRMVDKGELLSRLWPDTFVEEGALTRDISLLRKTLEEAGDETRYIETIPKRGYRFVSIVRTVAVEAPPEAALVEWIEVRQNRPIGRKWLALSVTSALTVTLALAGYLFRPRRI